MLADPTPSAKRSNKMMRTMLLAIGGILLAHAASGNESFAPLSCPLSVDNINLPSTCELRFQESDNFGHNLVLTAKIDLQPLIDSFADLLAAAVNKNSCRERAQVRHAHLSIDDGFLIASARIWIEKRYCEGPIKTRIFETTGNVVVRLKPKVSAEEALLEATIERIGLSEFEEQLADILGTNPRDALKRALESDLRVRVIDIGLPIEIAQSIGFRSALLLATPPQLQAELSANVDAKSLGKLLNLWLKAGRPNRRE